MPSSEPTLQRRSSLDARLKAEAAARDADTAQPPQPQPTTQPPPSAPPPPEPPSSHSVASSRVTLLEIVAQGHCDEGGVLQFGQLLQWMDIAACLAAEKHSRHNSVTLTMDDLHVDGAVRMGDVVRLEGVVNCAFSTSMEVGVTVTAESPTALGERSVCSACFIFVALGADGKKVKVAPVVPHTVEESHAFALAGERRALRLKHSAVEEEAAASLQGEAVPPAELVSPSRPTARGAVVDDAAAAARVLSCAEVMTELVLPQHANHHGNTFGGQIMAWMTKAATIVARRQVLLSQREAAAAAERRPERPPQPRKGGTKPPASKPDKKGEAAAAAAAAGARVVASHVDACHFLAASRVGDRVTLSARVSRVFGSSMEVSVAVSADDVGGGGARAINRGFLTMDALDAAGEPLPLLDVAPTDAEGEAEHEAAAMRRVLRIRRRQMMSFRSDPMPWSDVLAKELCICNLAGLLRVVQSTRLEWRPVAALAAGEPVPTLPAARGERPVAPPPAPFDAACAVNEATWGLPELVSFRTSCTPAGTLGVPPARVFALLCDASRRAEWDLQFRSGTLVRRIDERNALRQALLHIVFEPLAPGREAKPHDYALLQSVRQESEGCYIVSMRSVEMDEVPEAPQYERGAALPSGWMVRGAGGAGGAADQTEVVQVISLNPAKIGVTRAMFPTLGVLLLNNLLELHRSLVAPAAADAPSAEAAAQARKDKKQNMLAKVRSLVASAAYGSASDFTPELFEGDVLG